MVVKLSVAKAKNQFSDLIARIRFAKERFIIERRGKPVVAIIGYEEYKAIEDILEDLEDIQDAKEAMAEYRAGKGRPAKEVFDEIEE